MKFRRHKLLFELMILLLVVVVVLWVSYVECQGKALPGRVAFPACIAPCSQSPFAPEAWEVTGWSVDAGSRVCRAGDYSLYGTIGQADAGLLSGGSYSLRGGLTPPVLSETFLPLVVR